MYLLYFRKRPRLNLSLNRVKRSKRGYIEEDSCETPQRTPDIKARRPVVSSVKKRRKENLVKRKCHIRSALFPNDDSLSHAYNDVINFLPTVLEQLQNHNYLEDFMSLLRLISQNKFPLSNIVLYC